MDADRENPAQLLKNATLRARELVAAMDLYSADLLLKDRTQDAAVRDRGIAAIEQVKRSSLRIAARQIMDMEIK